MSFLFQASLYDLLEQVGVGPLPELVVAVLILFSLWVCMLANGIEHAFIYDRGARPLGPAFRIHEVDLFQEWGYYALLVLTGLPLLSCFGAALSGRIWFQGPINASTGEGWFDEPDRPVAYTVPYLSVSSDGWQPRFRFGLKKLHVRKLFVGRERIAQCVLGLLLFAVPFLW